MGMNEKGRTPMDMIDDALQTYPLEPASANIFPTVMRRIEIQRAAPKFKLSWLDYALSGFAAGMAGLVLFLWQSASLPPHWSAHLRHDILRMWQRVQLTLIHYQPQLPVEFYIVGLLLLMFGLMFFTRRRAPLVRISP